MDGVELRVVLCLTLEIHLSEHIQCRLFPSIGDSWTGLGLEAPYNFPALLRTLQAECLACLLLSAQL
jgi:hypothetical protein